MKPFFAACLFLVAISFHAVQAAVGQVQLIDVGGYRLNLNVTRGSGDLTIFFESSGGDDSSVWAQVAPAVAECTGATVITYDRAGLGKSQPAPGPYEIQDEVAALDRGLTKLGLQNNLVIVAHSYGGFVTALYAAEHPAQVRGLVLIDANLAPAFTPPVVERLKAGFAAHREEMQKKQPAAVRALDAFTATVQRMRDVVIPATIPCLVIAAEHPPTQSEEEATQWKRVHEAFVHAAPNRQLIVATGSSHFVMRDAPQSVISAVSDFVKKLPKVSSGS